MNALVEMRKKTPAELKTQLLEAQKLSMSFRIQKKTQQLKRISEIKRTRREIARMMTVLREMERKESES